MERTKRIYVYMDAMSLASGATDRENTESEKHYDNNVDAGKASPAVQASACVRSRQIIRAVLDRKKTAYQDLEQANVRHHHGRGHCRCYHT